MKSLKFLLPLLLPAAALCQQLSVTKFANTLSLPASFDPIIAAYWTGLPHHRRTPFSVSPDGKSAYLAYLDTTYNAVYVQQVDTNTFAAVGDAVQVEGAREAGGLVAQNDGFALLANFIPDAGTTDAPPNSYPIAEIVRYKDGAQAWRTPVNGPGVHEADGLSASPDMNGDLVYSEAAGLYAAYVVVTAYTGAASGHFGDSIQYVDDAGALQTIAGASSTWGCSHNTGIGLEAADAAPFASVCAEDQGAIWLNTDTQTMNGVKIANENTTNGVSGEPMGGMSGSYSNLALFPDTTSYIFAWQSRGALNLQENSWLGTGFTTCSPRWLNHNVAVSLTTSKDKLLGEQASSVVGAAEGDTQVTWITESDTTDHQNVHVATLDSGNAVVTWEELADPDCQPVPLSCTGTFNGTWAQVVGSKGEKVGEKVLLGEDVYVAGDMVTMGEKVCWPYVDMVWDLTAPKANGTYAKEISFACVSLNGSGDVVSSSTSAAATSSAAAATSSVAATSTLISAQDETKAATTVTRTFGDIAATSSSSSAAEVVSSTAEATASSEIDIGSTVELPSRTFMNIATIDGSEVTTTVTASSALIETVTSTEDVSTTSTQEVASSTEAATSAAVTLTELPTRSFGNIVTATDSEAVTVTSTATKSSKAAASSEAAASSSTDAAETSVAVTLTELPSRSFGNIVTATDVPTGIATSTDVSSSKAAASSSTDATETSVAVTLTELPTRSFDNIVTATDIPTEIATSATSTTDADPTSSKAAATSNITETFTELPTRSFDNIVTATETATATATRTLSRSRAIGTTTTITRSAAADTTAIETQTRTFTNIVTVSTTLATQTIVATPTAGADAWAVCADGRTCAEGLQCITFENGVEICVPSFEESVSMKGAGHRGARGRRRGSR